MENVLLLCVQAVLIGYLPGALIFRLPVLDPRRRASLDAEERAFWQVVLSLAGSLTIALVLAALERYRFERLLVIDAALIVLLAPIVIVRRSSWRAIRSASIRCTIALPLGLVVLGLWRFFPASEYVIGGKDPGVYINEGIQIAQRGTLTIHDPVVADVPAFARDLFFPSHSASTYYGTRFMGFFLRSPSTGDVNGQFPQLFPISIAIGYGLDGLSGARLTTGAWGILGLLAVYFLGARFVGKPAALAASALLGLNVVDVWFARYPNSELAAETLLFAALLAFARAEQDDDRFFVPVAATLMGLALFTRVEMVVGIAAMLGAGVLVWICAESGSADVRRRARIVDLVFVLWLLPWLVGGWLYYTGPLLPYFALPMGFVAQVPKPMIAAAAVAIGACLALLAILRSRFGDRIRSLVPLAIAAALVAAAVYAAFFRTPGGKLASHDAYALRNFTSMYLRWSGLAAALVGIAIVVRRGFWRDPAFVLAFSAFSFLFLYKIRVVPEEFWAARRLLPMILPGALIFAAAAGLGPPMRWRWPRRIAGLALVGVLAWQYSADAAPVLPHVEYAGIIPALERLASRFGDRDLVLVESRDAGSDTHVLGLPLAYIYARNVLVLNSARPDKLQLRLFLEAARSRYAHVYFIGGGGTDLLSRRISARPIADERLKIPEFETTSQRRPSAVQRKDFDYSVYELSLDAAAAGSFTLDIGDRDDLNVLRFNAKETTDGRTVRWTGPQSFVAIPGMTGSERRVVLVMHDGGRPARAPQAHVEVYLNGTRLGGADVRSGFQPYVFAIPPDAAARAAATEDPAQLTLVSTVWTPRQYVGGTDDRRLGVMVDRVEIR